MQRAGVPGSCVTSGKSRHFSKLFIFYIYKMGYLNAPLRDAVGTERKNMSRVPNSVPD